MLNWIVIWVGSYLFGIGGPLQSDVGRATPVERHRRGRPPPGLVGRPDPAGPAHRVLRRARRARRLLDDAEPHDARLRGACSRVQPRGRALRRHQRGSQLFPRHGDRRRVRRACRGTRHPGLEVPPRHHDIQGSTIGFVGIAVALLGRNTAVGVGLAALLFAGLQTGTSTRNLDPEVFRPELASSLTLIIQGLIVLFVGADLIVLLCGAAAPAVGSGKPFTT